MQQIILTNEQAETIATVLNPVPVRDSKGSLLGTFTPIWTEDDIADAKRRLASDEPRYTTAQVVEYLRSLEQK